MQTLRSGTLAIAESNDERYHYSARFNDMTAEAVKRKLISQDEADGYDVRCANNILDMLNIPNTEVIAEDIADGVWLVYWK